MRDRHFSVTDIIDVRRRGKGVAQVFPTQEALWEYTVVTASYFPRDCPKAGLLLKWLQRKSRSNNIVLAQNLPPSQPQHMAKKAKAKTKDKGAKAKAKRIRCRYYLEQRSTAQYRRQSMLSTSSLRSSSNPSKHLSQKNQSQILTRFLLLRHCQTPG